jgi:Transposase
MAKRFTEAEKQAALADLKNGITLEQAAKKHKCSTASLMQWKKTHSSNLKAAGKRTPKKATAASGIPSSHTARMMELEDENKYLKDENQSLRGLMLDGYIGREQHPKLRQIAQTLRDAGRSQLQRIMEIILVVEAREPTSSESPDRPDSAVDSQDSNGLPRHPSGAVRLRRKAEHDA